MFPSMSRPAHLRGCKSFSQAFFFFTSLPAPLRGAYHPLLVLFCTLGDVPYPSVGRLAARLREDSLSAPLSSYTLLALSWESLACGLTVTALPLQLWKLSLQKLSLQRTDLSPQNPPRHMRKSVATGVAAPWGCVFSVAATTVLLLASIPTIRPVGPCRDWLCRWYPGIS